MARKRRFLLPSPRRFARTISASGENDMIPTTPARASAAPAPPPAALPLPSPAPAKIYVRPLRFKLDGRPILSADLRSAGAGVRTSAAAAPTSPAVVAAPPPPSRRKTELKRSMVVPSLQRPAETAPLFECFPYVCPEPVLVKWFAFSI